MLNFTLQDGFGAILAIVLFPLVYLFHRYALAAAINVVGSAKIPLSLTGDGQTVVALVNGEATVKTYFKKPGHIELHPANPAMQPVNPLGHPGKPRSQPS